MATICPHYGEDIEAIEEEAHHLQIFRGGCWATECLNSAYRFSFSRHFAEPDIGFRLVLPQ